MISLATHLTQIVATLRAAIGTHVGRLARPRHSAWIGDRFFIAAERTEPTPHVTPEAWAVLWRRHGRLANRFTTLFDRWQANTLPRPRARKPARPTPAQGNTDKDNTGKDNTGQPTPDLRLPRANGWVNHRIPDSAPPTGQLDAFLRDRAPELRQFLAAAPQAGRYLRPLCRALGLPQPDWLRLPPRPRRPRRRPPPEPAPHPRWPAGPRRPATHPSPMRPEDKPLRPWVHRTARAWKKSRG